MIGGKHSVRIACSDGELFTFMETFSNWASYVVGFQSLRQIDDATAVWTLRGDVGILSREVDIEVRQSGSEPGRSATFELTGLTERLTGSGSFEVSARDPAALDDGTAGGVSGPPAPATPAPRLSWWARLRRSTGRWMVRRARRSTEPPQTAAPSVPEIPVASSRPSTDEAWLTFRLEVQPGGAMAPMVEMLMAPLLEPAAEDLSLQIQQAIEGRSA